MVRTQRQIWLSTLSILIWCTLLAFSHSALARKASLVFAADMPVIGDDDKGRYAELGTLLAQQRRQSSPTFFVFGGGSLGPSPMAGFDRGSHIIDILNSLEPDAMGITKREFSYYEEELSLRSYEAAFPIVASNLFDALTQSNLDGLVDQVVVTKGGLKIGLVSVLDESTVDEYLLTRVQIRDPKLAIEASAAKLRYRGVDCIILVYSYPFDFIIELLDDNIVDMAMISDPHFDITENRQLPQHPNNVYVTKAGQAAIVDFEWQDGDERNPSIDWRLVKLDEFVPNPEIQLQIKGYTNRLTRLLDEQIGVLSTLVDTRRPVVRGRESAFGNLVADTLRTFTHADVGLINGGIIRGEKIYQPETPLSRGDVLKELPFRSRVVLLEMSGQQLLAGLENGVSSIGELKGRFPQISGAQYSFNPRAKVGSRITGVTIDGEELDLQATYRVATSNYLADGGDGYTSFKQARRIPLSGNLAPLISDLVTINIRRQKIVEPKIEGRIVREEG